MESCSPTVTSVVRLFVWCAHTSVPLLEGLVDLHRPQARNFPEKTHLQGGSNKSSSVLFPLLEKFRAGGEDLFSHRKEAPRANRPRRRSSIAYTGDAQNALDTVFLWFALALFPAVLLFSAAVRLRPVRPFARPPAG